ncbi:methyltransferase domain-containing protein [Paenibacillus thiaminolyticus]|uniref:class I SAM-dependent methyltransferase n=1 Tax=Paenibacillus TaxID=44249 RepID=UPI001059ACA2|nr:class I SAM-dependent methyltransferase [Paenibacillus dendritiformis]TDL49258.1 class I SAM-dependent methyltransferase [Paenibacillus dendritiformis]
MKVEKGTKKESETLVEDFVNRIQKNNLYYDRFVANIASRSDKRDFTNWINEFCALVPDGGTVLDIGCGTGIHLKKFHDMGYDVLGIEPSKEMRKHASQEGLKVVDGAFETLSTLELPKVSGVWCASSLLHVPKNQLLQVLKDIRNVLHKEGALFVTVRVGTSAMWDRYDETAGEAERFIQLYEEKELFNRLTSVGFEVCTSMIEQSYWGRPVPWISIIARKM